MLVNSKDMTFLSLLACMLVFVVGTGSTFNAKVNRLQGRMVSLENSQVKSYGYASEAMRDAQDARAAIRNASLHTPKPTPTTERQETPKERPVPIPGDTVTVYDPDAGGAYLTVEGAWTEAQKAFGMQNEEESDRILKKLDDDGKLILEENGTRLKVLQGRFFTYKVRVLSGNNVGWEGWIPRRLVRKVESQ